MKVICITGAVHTDLHDVMQTLNRAGLIAAKPSARGDALDIAGWHERVTGMKANDVRGMKPFGPLGMMWGQLAGDIFIANITSPVWGWYDSRSTWLLDYFVEYDPDIYFILVCISPEDVLIGTMENDSSKDSVADIMSSWHSYHLEMLRFYHKYPNRSMFVDVGDCLENQQAFVNACASHWGLPLSLSAQSCTPPKQHSPLSSYLAERLCKQYPEVMTLQREIEATISKFNESLEKSKLTPDDIIAHYRELRDRSALLEQLAKAQKVISSLTVERDTYERQAVANQNQLNQINASLPDITHLKNSVKMMETKYEDLKRDNEILLIQIQQLQEELELNFLKSQSQLKQADEKWQHMLKCNPEYVEYESILISRNENADIPSVAWQFKNFTLCGRFFSDFKVTVFLEDGVAGFNFSRLSNETSPLLRWPLCAEKEQAITIIPVANQQNAQERYSVYLDLSTSDWLLVQALSRYLPKTLNDASVAQVLNNSQKEAFASGFERFLSIIKTFPGTIRYDRAELKREAVNPDYEHLWLRFENFMFGEKKWPDFEFRISCANVQSNYFGAHPKMEFPETIGEAPFESWFRESSDDFGFKLELRFELPLNMDRNVWQRLSANDRFFIANLSNRLPFILNEFQFANIRIGRAWNDWIRMALEVQNIIAVHSASPQ